MTVYRILSVTVRSTNELGRAIPEQIVANLQVGKASKVAEVDLYRRDAYRLADQLLTALYRTGEQ